MAANEMHAIMSRISNQIKANKKQNNFSDEYNELIMLYG